MIIREDNLDVCNFECLQFFTTLHEFTNGDLIYNSFDLMEFVYSIMVVVNQGKSQRQRQR